MSTRDQDRREQPDLDVQRLDKWLWHARFARTRTAAARLVADGYIRVNAKRACGADKRVRIGDVLTISLRRVVRVVRVTGFAPRRGPAVVAQTLFEAVRSDDPD